MSNKLFFAFIALNIAWACTPKNNEEIPKKDDSGIRNGMVKTLKGNGKLGTECGYINNVRNGPCKDFYDNGKVRMEMTYENGKRTGVSKFYRENGELYRVSIYKNDTLDGIQTYYHPNGLVLAEVPYKNGALQKGTKEFDKTGVERTKSPKLKIEVENLVKMNGQYTIRLSVDGMSYKKATFYKSAKMDANKFENLANKLDDNVFKIYVSPGYSVMEQFYFMAEIESKLDIPYLVTASHNVSVTN
jgi:antitoxin component YwqK of YwqJK toxin-antitoxin module